MNATAPSMSRPTPNPRLADHRTPLVLNCWYVAALSEEVDQSLRSRRLLETNVLLYRRRDGSPVALRNRCPHRSFPLSHGKREEDSVVCGYHGLTFQHDGSCARIPSQERISDAIRTRAYPLVERAPLIWIWMGDPELGDPTTIPDTPWLNAPDYAHVRGYMHMKTNYIRLHENVLDLTHFPFLHGEELADVAYAQAPFTVTEHGNSVCIARKLDGHPVNPGNAAVIGNHGHRVNRATESWFKTPGFHIAHTSFHDLEGGVGGRTTFNLKINHLVTPESTTSTHYFWASARDFRIDDTAFSEVSTNRAKRVFLEDVDALERIEEIWTREDQDFQEISVASDRAGLLMRRIIAGLAAKETNVQSVSS